MQRHTAGGDDPGQGEQVRGHQPADVIEPVLDQPGVGHQRGVAT
jgi:hypothetical protein